MFMLQCCEALLLLHAQTSVLLVYISIAICLWLIDMWLSCFVHVLLCYILLQTSSAYLWLQLFYCWSLIFKGISCYKSPTGSRVDASPSKIFSWGLWKGLWGGFLKNMMVMEKHLVGCRWVVGVFFFYFLNFLKNMFLCFICKKERNN